MRAQFSAQTARGNSHRRGIGMGTAFAGDDEFHNARFAARIRAEFRAQRKNKCTRKKKFVDPFPHLNYALAAIRVMTFNTHSQHFPVTRYCGLKGGILNGD